MKNKRALFLLLTANIVSGFAQGISMLAIPWYFISILKAPSTFGILYMSVTLVSLFWSLYSGTLVDRYSRKNIFLLTSLCGGIIIGSVSITGFALGYVPIAFIILVFATTIFTYNIHYPTLYAFGQEITEVKNYGKINSYIEIQGQVTTIISGAIAAMLLQGTANETVNILGMKIHIPFTIVPWKLQEIFLMDAITYFLAIILISFIRYIPQVDKIIHTGKVWERIKTGYYFLTKNPLLFLFGNASFSIFVVLLVQVQFLIPIYVNNHLHAKADVYASAEIFYSIGALLAGAGIRWLFRNVNTVLSIILMMLLTVILFYMCTFTQSISVFYVFSFLIGITNAGTRVLRTTYLFEHIPNEVMGRTNSVYTVINTSLRMLLIGIFSLAFFSKADNIIWTYFLCGTFVLLSVFPLIRKYKLLVK